MTSTSTKTRDPAATREAILKAAREEFGQHGLAGARVDRIANKACVNKERIYAHFGNKQKLFDITLTHALEQVRDIVDDSANTDPAAFVARVFEFNRHNPHLTRMLMWEALQSPTDGINDEAARRAYYAERVKTLTAGTAQPDSAKLLLTLIGLGAWPHAFPALTSLIIGEHGPLTPENTLNELRDFLVEFTRRATN
ncbi:MAG: TetR family transcriptional regulator [Corynebacteriales bacterium]|nr:TetR family transcriptional regulator [Mycobacteriales bacterium]